MVYPVPAWVAAAGQTTVDGVAASRQRRTHLFTKTSRFGDDEEPRSIGAAPLRRPANGGYRSGSVGFKGRDARPAYGKQGMVGDGPQAIFYTTETKVRSPVKGKGRNVGPIDYDASNERIVRNLSTAPTQPRWTMCAHERGIDRPIPSRPQSAAASSAGSARGASKENTPTLPGAVGKQQLSKLDNSPAWTMAELSARHHNAHLLQLTSGLVGYTVDRTAGPGPGSYNHEGFYGSERLSRSRSAPRFSLPKQQRHMELPPRDTNPGLPNSKRFPGRPATASGTRSVT